MSDQIAATLCTRGFLHVWVFYKLIKDKDGTKICYRCRNCGAKRYVLVTERSEY